MQEEQADVLFDKSFALLVAGVYPLQFVRVVRRVAGVWAVDFYIRRPNAPTGSSRRECSVHWGDEDVTDEIRPRDNQCEFCYLLA